MLEAVNLTKSHAGKLALSGVSLKLPPGEFFCLLGKADSGKSTLLDLFLGMTKPTSGAANVYGVSASVTAQTRARLAAVPGGYALYPDLTLAENIDFFLNASRLPGLGADQCRDLLADCSLDPALARRFARDLTAGERQRAGVAIGLARDARAFLCDEPFAGLDDQEAMVLGELLRAVATGEAGGDPAVVLVASSSPVPAYYAHRIGLLAKGKLAAVVVPGEAFDWESTCQRHLEAA